jgi:hypothetical protein
MSEQRSQETSEPIADLRRALEFYEQAIVDPQGAATGVLRDGHQMLLDAVRGLVGDSGFTAGLEYAEPNGRNGKTTARGPLFWFSAESRKDPKDGVTGWLHEEQFNEIADRLGLPKLMIMSDDEVSK